ncbi:MAG: SRPBCC domain-containing protein [Pseudolysinimonas sp.]
MPYADHTFDATIVIDSAPEKIWTLLVDVAAWPSWDSGIIAARGAADKVGAKLSVTSGAAPKTAFAVKVTKLDPRKELVIVGGAPFGLFKGVRTFTLTPEGKGTRFTMHEVYSGPLLGAIWKQIPDLDPSFQQFANGLKAQAEARG